MVVKVLINHDIGHSNEQGSIRLGNLGKTLPVPERPTPVVHVTNIYNALLEGKSGGYPSDIKLLYILGCNMLNQFLNTNKGMAALKVPEFIVVHELFLTPTARYADIILPVTTTLERTDIGQPWIGGPYFIHMDRAIEPLPQTKSDLTIFTELASRLGIPDYNDKSDEAWLREFAATTPDLPEYEVFKRKGFHRIPLSQPWVALSPLAMPRGCASLGFNQTVSSANSLRRGILCH